MEHQPDEAATLADLLIANRAAAGLTQEELADRAQLSVRAISNLERGESSRPRRGTVERLSRALGLTGRDAELFAAVARGRRPAPPSPGPAQLPTDLPDFTGRDRQLNRLTDLLRDPAQEGVRIVVLDGGAGVGKTSLAVRAAHLVREHFPDGQLYLDLAGSRAHPLTPSTALAGFLTAMGADSGERAEGVAARAARYRSVLAGRRVLILLDDARDAAQVRPLLPAGPGSAVLVTSRSRLPDLAGASHLPLGRLSGPEAVTLLAVVAGRDRTAAEPAAAARVVSACERLPLAVRIAGARLAARPRWSVATLADRLAETRGRLDELRVGDLAVRASFRLSYDRLGAQVSEVFALLGLWPGHDIPVRAAAALAGQPTRYTERALEELVDRHLLESPAPERYRQHDLLHAFARELLVDDIGPERSAAATHRLISFVAATAYRADLMLWPASEPPFPVTVFDAPEAMEFGGHADATSWYRAEWPALSGLLRQLAAQPPSPASGAARLASLLALYPFVRGDFVELERCARQSATLAEHAGDDLLTATAHKRLGIALLEQRRHEEAAHHHELALAAFRAAGARDGEATILNSIGRRLMYEADRSGTDDPDRYDRARNYLLDSLAAARESGRRSAQVAALCNLGGLEHRAGRDTAAYRYLCQALPLARELGGGQVEAAVVSNLGAALAGLGQLTDAVRAHERALAITRRLGDRHGEASALAKLSETHLTAGQAASAADCARRALRIRQRASEPVEVAGARALLGRALRAGGSRAEAEKHLRWALPVLSEADPATAARVRALLAD